jgi:hypothetical protein
MMPNEPTEAMLKRQAECDCHPDFHVCTAIAEMERLEKWDRQREKDQENERLEELRKATLIQAKFLKTMAVRGMVEFCDNVIELLSEKEDDDDGR